MTVVLPTLSPYYEHMYTKLIIQGSIKNKAIGHCGSTSCHILHHVGSSNNNFITIYTLPSERILTICHHLAKLHAPFSTQTG